MRIVALDPSLTATGVCDSQAPNNPYTIEPNQLRGMARLRWIQKRVIAAVGTAPAIGPQDRRADLVVIEGYSHASRHQAHALGELGGVIRLTLYMLGVPYVDVAPKVRAKLATGKGNASKDDVFAAAFTRLGYRGSSKDEADARWLLEVALQHYRLPGRAELPQAHLAPLAKSRPDWPSLDDLRAA